MLTIGVHGTAPASAAPCLGTNAVGFFTNLANLFFQESGCSFTVTNIPVFDGTNFVYTPGTHRLLQLAANIYDASTNRTFSDGTSPNGPFYPSVFRPTFGTNGNTVFINGFVEEGGGTTNYQVVPLSLPQDLALVGSNTINIYGVPWVIGARKGFPNFNQFSMLNFSQITRALQIVKPSQGAWQTNQMYTIGISNLIAVEAWNSYSNNYPRAVDIVASDNLTFSLTNEYGINLSGSLITNSFPTSISSNSWPGFATQGSTNPAGASFLVPLYFGATILPNSVYQQTPPAFITSGQEFQNVPGFIFPNFILAVTNKLRFVMLDHATGRVIDYVHFDRASSSEDLADELIELDSVMSNVWSTNAISASNSLPVGIFTQYAISVGALQIPPAEWAGSGIPPNESSIQQAIKAFQNFLVGNSGVTTMQMPYVPFANFAHYYSWQANDPLVHYTIEDLTDLGLITNSVIEVALTGSNAANLFDLTLPNERYAPWDAVSYPLDHYGQPSIGSQDPLIYSSDDWNFPSGQPLSFSWMGAVHRGTPWQTFYLKSAAVDPVFWQYWTGNANVADAALSMPTSDWQLAALLSTLFNTNEPNQLISVNQTNISVWAEAFEGLTVLTNTASGLMPLTIDTNTDSNAISVIVASINAERAASANGFFTNFGQVLASPFLSVGSPFLDESDTSELNDAAYESLPSQLLPLLRTDSLGAQVQGSVPPQFQFSGMDGAAYIIQVSTNLQDWSGIGTFYPTNGSFVFTDSSSGTSACRYYRSVLAP